MRSSLLGSLVVFALVSGCSLVMDTSPPDPIYGTYNGDAGMTQIPCDHDDDCNDGVVCNGIESCGSAGYCVLGTPVVCPSVGCAIGECYGDGECKKVPTDSACDDAIDCTIDSCSDTGQCTHALDNTVCDDDIDCTRDVCLGVAIGQLRSGCYNVPQDNLCPRSANTSGNCAVDVCAPAASADNTGCAPAPLNNCSPSMRCNFDTYVCEHLPTGDCTDGSNGCDDGYDCNGVEVCDTSNGTGLCVPGTPACENTDATCQRTVCDIGADTPVCIDVRKYDTACLAPIVGVTPGG